MEDDVSSIPIYIGTDPHQHMAEAVLEHSIRKHASVPVDIHWMRAGDPPWDDWVLPFPKGGTPFSPFRFFVPEVCGYDGYAIYLDVDMVLRADIAELWEFRQEGKFVTPLRPDVAVIDCSAFRDWPTVAESKPTSQGVPQYTKMLGDRWARSVIPETWDTCDAWTDEAKLVHYTCIREQPWHPYPEKEYRRHRDDRAASEWWKLHEEAMTHAH